ncbi:MAG: glycoside hydrolase family 88 protein, partial [Paludibacter sp.]|nr:glycoside hydrolase family 88 protein [Paludibacter sp.]
MKQSLLTLTLGMVLLIACKGNAGKCNQDLINDNVKFATQQIGRQVEIIEDSDKILNPRTIKCDKIQYVPIEDWTSGFFPGTMWYMYELTGDEKWKNLGIKYTEDLDSVKYLTWHHDVGFMINTSFGNAYRLTQNEAYKNVMVEAAKSLATRYRPTPGVIQSWDENRGWQGTRGWMCPVIIDNMMNLELFFKATHFTGDSSFYKMAVSHADVTLENHFRKDFSCYHVIDYDKIKGGVRHKQTAQGYADESAWA